MVHGLAEQSGGHFRLKSRLGEGTSAELWLPVDEAAVSAVEQKRAEPAEIERPQTLLVVLAVDDDELVLNNTVAMLEDLGHTAIAAPSAEAALEALRKDDSIDVVITDQVMPHMTGAQLAEAIKAEWPQIAVVLATGFAETPASALGLPRLSKPFTQVELSERLAGMQPLPGKARVLRFPAGNGKV
jgi:CheY-like chemotaxis protein